VLECVVNISEGRSPDVVATLARACGPVLLDLHTDADHHRTVFTLASIDPTATEAAARRLAAAAVDAVSLTDHDGVHPRLGAVDVVPFVAIAPTSDSVAVDAARDFARWIGAELQVPAFLYDRADAEHRTLPSVRRDAFSVRAPDAGPSTPHARAGATAVGARGVLVAINLELDQDDLDLARAVARQIRERGGGLPGVRALGLRLASVARAQVSMNLVAPEVTGIEVACRAARDRIEAAGGSVRRVELVGLVPASLLEPVSPEFLGWSGLGPNDTIEARLATLGASDEDPAGAPRGAGPGSPA